MQTKSEMINRIAKLAKENAELKAELQIRDNIAEHFRKEALSWANIANECQKDRTKLEQTLQEIRTIAEDRTKTEDYLLGQEYTDLVDKIIDLITKAESEG